MGAGSSKPEAAADSKHIFSSNSPVQFSSNLVEALQSSSETDSSRAKSLELEIQSRVASELARLREREQQTLAEIEKRLAEVRDSGESAATPSTRKALAPAAGYVSSAGSLDLDAPRIPFAGREHDPLPAYEPVGESPSGGAANRQLSSTSVMSEIEQLRSKLDGRRKLAELDEGVARAQAEVVACLRLNDRRPLDCWKEVGAFKREVARMEEAFVDRIVG